MELTSTSFEPGGELAQPFGKKADNVSPQLSWDGVPDGTRSFALSFVDLHPVARGYVHWLVVDIDAEARELAEGAAAGALPGRARELVPYAGPFPPSGTHEYLFTLYALDTEQAPVGARATLDQFQEAVKASALATATLSCTFTKLKG
jgi:Raf kinase inhibitor-like YbhB/YbcL family protein